MGCRARRPQHHLVRVAAGPAGVQVGRAVPGRGAWLCGEQCLDRSCRKGALARALRTGVDAATIDQLRESFCATTARMTESSTGTDEVAAMSPSKG